MTVYGHETYRKISRNLEAARLGVIIFVSLWNLTAMHLGSAAVEVPVKKWLEKSKPEYRDFESSRNRTVRQTPA